MIRMMRMMWMMWMMRMMMNIEGSYQQESQEF